MTSLPSHWLMCPSCALGSGDSTLEPHTAVETISTQEVCCCEWKVGGGAQLVDSPPPTVVICTIMELPPTLVLEISLGNYCMCTNAGLVASISITGYYAIPKEYIVFIVERKWYT